MFADFEFQNFTPSQGVKIYGNTMLLQLAAHLPHPFTTVATMKKIPPRNSEHGEPRYTCHLEVFSDEGLFLQESSSSDPMAAIDGVEFKLRQQISDWLMRRNTFTPLNLRNFKKLAIKYFGRPNYIST